jgi:hypothetical protein
MTDYYEIEDGCCLTCPDAEPDCLCFECNCKKCDAYESLGDGTGYCTYASHWKSLAQERQDNWLSKKEWIQQQRMKDALKNIKSAWLIK